MAKKTIATTLFLLLTMQFCLAQTAMADAMRSNGKIYVVVAVLATIFAGIFAYLLCIDRKITKLEKGKK